MNGRAIFLVITAAVPVTTSLPANFVANSSMSEGVDRPAGWKLWRDTRLGKVEIKSDREIFKSPDASLRLSSLGAPVSASASCQLILPPATGAILVRGSARMQGSALKESVLAVQSFDASDQQIGWATVAPLINSGEWLDYEASVKVPKSAVTVRLLVTLRGEGSVWLDDVTAEVDPAAR